MTQFVAYKNGSFIRALHDGSWFLVFQGFILIKLMFKDLKSIEAIDVLTPFGNNDPAL